MEQTDFDKKMDHVELLAYHARMAAMTLPTRGQCIVDDKTAIMDEDYFADLGVYDCSLPSGTYIGKRWKHDRNAYTFTKADWFMGEFAGIEGDQIGITWRKIIVISGGR